MKAVLLIAGVALVASGCATTATQTAWGKPGVSKTDYGTDVGMCTGLASRATAAATRTLPVASAAGTTRPRAAAQGQHRRVRPCRPAAPIQGMASSDYAQRAATQQRTQQMAEQRARADALKGCLVERGYQEFALTPEQAAHLATLQKGSNEYLEYIYKLGSDAEIVGKQSKAPAK